MYAKRLRSIVVCAEQVGTIHVASHVVHVFRRRLQIYKGVAKSLRLFDKKIEDVTLSGPNPDEITAWLQGVERVDGFEYYEYAPGVKWPLESEEVKGKPVREVLDFLSTEFTESLDSFVEVQKKVFKSGRHQVIVRKITAISSKRETTKIAVLNYNKSL